MDIYLLVTLALIVISISAVLSVLILSRMENKPDLADDHTQSSQDSADDFDITVLE